MTSLPDYSVAIASALDGSWTPTPIEDVPLPACAGRLLAGPILADRDLPPFDRVTMDGYALRAADLAGGLPLPVAGDLPAGAAESPPVAPGQCLRVATGAPLPEDLDTVIPHEWTDRGSPVTVHHQPERGNAVHARGEDARLGDTLVAVGTRMGPVEQGLAATVGQSSVRVHARPRITLLASGDEVVPVSHAPAPHQIRNSNLPMVSELLHRLGGLIQLARHLPDDVATTREAVDGAIASSDLVVTIGGISQGRRDAFRAVLEERRVPCPVRGVAMQPGKPVTIARFDSAGKMVPLVALPGNPVSALATACLFAGPLLNRLQGGSGSLPWMTGHLAAAATPHRDRRRFRPVRRRTDGGLVVPSWKGSGDLAHAAGTIGLVDLPPGPADLPAGTPVQWLAWP